MRVLPHLYIPGIMDILVIFEGDVKYVKVDIPDVEDSIPDDLCRSVCSKKESKASPLISLR